MSSNSCRTVNECTAKRSSTHPTGIGTDAMCGDQHRAVSTSSCTRGLTKCSKHLNANSLIDRYSLYRHEDTATVDRRTGGCEIDKVEVIRKFSSIVDLIFESNGDGYCIFLTDRGAMLIAPD
jgi:hypothetical protein